MAIGKRTRAKWANEKPTTFSGRIVSDGRTMQFSEKTFSWIWMTMLRTNGRDKYAEFAGMKIYA